MTVQKLIETALVKINVIVPGQSLATEELNDGMAVLNNMIASWNAQQVPLPSYGSQDVTLTGAASYTLATRVMRIKSAEVVTTIGTSKVPRLVDGIAWSAIQDKTKTGIYADDLFCDYAYPNSTVRMSPIPATGTLRIWAFTQLAQFTSLSQTIALPDGYERALTYGLAVDLAPEYGRTVTPEVSGIANESKNAISQLNATVLGEARPGTGADAQAA